MVVVVDGREQKPYRFLDAGADGAPRQYAWSTIACVSFPARIDFADFAGAVFKESSMEVQRENRAFNLRSAQEDAFFLGV